MKLNQPAETATIVASNLIPITDESSLRESGVYLSRKTLRRYHSQGKYPRLLIKILGKIFLDKEQFNLIIIEAKRKRDERITRLNQVINGKLKAEVQQ